MTPTRLIYTAAGEPAIPGAEAVHTDECWLCGLPAKHTIPTQKFIRTSVELLARASAPRSGRVCAACAYCFLEQCAELTAMTGRDRPQKMRTYTHFVVGGRWMAFTKSDKARIAELLLSGPFPELAAISDTQQKHVIYKAKCNPPGQASGGWVQLEDASIYVDREKFTVLFETVNRQYRLYPKSEIESGSYNLRWIMQNDVREWDANERLLRQERGSPLFDLALWLAQRPARDDAPERAPAGQLSFL